MRSPLIYLAISILLGGCATPAVPPPSAGHLKAGSVGEVPAAAIPELVSRSPYLPPPSIEPPAELYTVVVDNVPLKELLFALARDAKINVDIHPGIEGTVTMNAIDQTLPRLLERISRQADIRYKLEGDNIIIEPDTPYLEIYTVDYVNLTRDSSGAMTVSSQILSTGSLEDSAGSSGNNTGLSITNESKHHLWEMMAANLSSILGDSKGTGGSDNVIVNPETGVVIVRATSKQHEKIREYLDVLQVSAQRQVLIEATIVEVSLSDEFKAGIDWSIIQSGIGTNFVSNLSNASNFVNLPAASLVVDYFNPTSKIGNVFVVVDLLKQFGDTKVLSSPKIMALNNQAAVLKVVRNEVFFEIEVDKTTNQITTETTFDTTAHSIPVGLIMSVLPQISADDSIILNVRPTISRVVGFVEDPNPALKDGTLLEPIRSFVPVIESREMESVLRLGSGQIAILGGLMEERVNKEYAAIPGLDNLGPISDVLFKSRSQSYTKTELVIFLRATVIRTASIEGDLSDFRPFLQNNTGLSR